MSKVIDGISSEIHGEWAHIGLAAAFNRLAEATPARSVALFEHGTLQVKLYIPRGTDRELVDPQTPHTRDELYVVARGSGVFFNGETRRKAEVGDLIFAPTGKAHRFEGFSEDFAVWVMFYGPEGGESLV